MSKLREKKVQEKALHELENHYRNKGAEHLYSRCEMQTKKGKGGGRADGLLCYKNEKGHFYTISLEAKSHRTLHNLISAVNDNKLGKYCVASAIALTVLTTVLLTTFFDLMWYWTGLVAIVTVFISFLVSIRVFDWLDLDLHREIYVVNQLKRYPTNEQWIAYSKDAYNLLAKVSTNGRKSPQQVLDKLCRNNGFGLMLISRQKAEMKIMPEPKKRLLPRLLL